MISSQRDMIFGVVKDKLQVLSASTKICHYNSIYLYQLSVILFVEYNLLNKFILSGVSMFNNN